MIQVTDAAAEKVKDHLAREKEQLPQGGLRLYAQPGGCSGMRYGLALDEPQEGDHIFDAAGIHVIVDPTSLEHLDGATVDYREGEDGEGFAIHNPKAASGCCCSDGGSGCSE
jgi:iron-sulfur cluster assembly accessory protein